MNYCYFFFFGNFLYDMLKQTAQEDFNGIMEEFRTRGMRLLNFYCDIFVKGWIRT